MQHLIYSLFLLILCGCHLSSSNDNVYGADEFVLDSYQIKEGNFSFLQLANETDMDVNEEYVETIQEGDRLNILLIHPIRSDLVQNMQMINQSMGFFVMNGAITFPSIGPVEVEGLTLIKAKELIQEKFQQAIADVEIYCDFQHRSQREVELLGLTSISAVAVDGQMRLFEVLSRAKISPEANLFKSYIVRGNKLLNVDFQKLVHEGDMSQNIALKPKDKIYIAAQDFANMMVLGEVGEPRVIPLPNGKLSLKEVLTKARGLLPTADHSYIQIFRGNIQCPKTYILHFDQVMRLANDSMLVIPGDVVYIASKPITKWNRFISQLLPSFAGFEMLDKGVKQVGVFLQ